MAEPIDFVGADRVLDPAPGDEDRVGKLPSYYADESGEIITCWKLTPEEISHVVMTGEVWSSQLVGRRGRLQPQCITGFPLMQNLDGSRYLAGGPLDEKTKAFLLGD